VLNLTYKYLFNADSQLTIPFSYSYQEFKYLHLLALIGAVMTRTLVFSILLTEYVNSIFWVDNNFSLPILNAQLIVFEQ